MPGSTYHPLEIVSESGQKSEYEKFREAAKAASPRDELIGLTLSDSGLRCSAMAHLRESWIEWVGDTLIIDVPPYEECIVGSIEDGAGGDRTQTGEPCWWCEERERGEKDWLPSDHKLPDNGDCWHPKSEAGWKGRRLPIKEEDTQQILTTYFRVYDAVCGQNAVRAAVKRIAKDAGIFVPGEAEGERDWPTPHDLRDTYGTKLALMGFSRDEIKNPMGHASIQQADDYIQMSGVEATKAFDEKWDDDLN